MNDRVETFYHATAEPAAFDDPLPAETETVVVGGGLAGLTVADGLATRNRQVVLLEAKTIGFGASGRNGGFVSPGFAASAGAIEARIGREGARAVNALAADGAERVRRTIAAVERPDIIAGTGWLKVVRHGDGAPLRRIAESRDGVLEFVERSRLGDLLVTKRYRAGLLDPRAFHIQPLSYARALATRARDAGATLKERSPVASLGRDGGGWQVLLADGARIRARHVVLCGSAYQGGLWPALERALLPVATYVVASRPADDLLATAIRFKGCIADTRRAGDYFRLVPGTAGVRLLWGGRITTRRSLPPRLVEALRWDITAVFPQLRHLQLEAAWMGLMGYTRHKMPIIGRLDDGIWTATAFGGHGLNTTAMGGDLIAAAIADGDDQWRRFLPFHTRWGGGWPGRVAAQGAYWAMQARDKIDEAVG